MTNSRIVSLESIYSIVGVLNLRWKGKLYLL